MIGKEILNYRIERLIGQGGMGSVYLAANKNFNQKVAIKVLKANLADSEIVRKKFIDEAKMLLKLNHQNIVKFLNFYENEEGVFLIMEYVDGITLDRFINEKNGLMVEIKAYELFTQILDAFTYAHKMGIVHRDIKPANIILTNDNEGNFVVKILDFGIAKIISESNDDEKGLIIGTPAYMSPEQVRGENVDARSDIYSLGVLLHQMLTGHAPYDTTTLSETEIQNKVVCEPLPRMKEFYQYVSDKLQKMVDKATQKDPEKRYQTCNNFRTALKNAIDPDKLSNMVKYAAAALVALLIGLGGWSYYYFVPHTYYYKDYVEQWGVPVGIGKADYQNRVESYRFIKERGKIVRVSHINCKGNITEHSDSEHTERYNDIKLYYANSGKVDYVEILDRNGKVLHKKDYDENMKTVVFKQNDEFGTEIFLAANTTQLFSNAFDLSHDRKSKITRYLLTYDENGFLKKLQYATFGNELVCDAEGLYGKEYIVDKKGRVIEEHYLGFDGTPKANKAGLAIKKFEYDSNDNWTKVSYFAANNEPSSDGNGCPVVILANDKYGNRIKESYYNEHDSLSLRTDVNVAGFTYTIEKGCHIRQAAFGIDGQACYNGNNGYSSVEEEYDANAYLSKITFKDLENNPVSVAYGNVSLLLKNDERGNIIEKRYLNTENQLCETTDGFAKIVSEYDSLGNQTSVFFYGVNDSLCLTGNGYAGVKFIYDKNKNKLTEIAYFGIDNQPCEVSGFHISKMEYDQRGNEIKRSFYAADGKTPVLSDEDIAGWEYKYNDNGNITEMWYFDAKGNKTSGKLSFAGYTCAYDKNGYLEEIKNLDKNGNLVYAAKDGYARIKYINDQRGNHIEIGEYDANNRLIGTLERRIFNNRDDIVERSYFDANGHKALHDGYHKLVSVYNERHQEIEARAYNTNEQLANVPSGFAIMKVKYNKQGFIIEYATYDTAEKLVVSGASGYAFRRIEYDAMNRERRVTYFDENSEPTQPDAHIPEELQQYDKWGNLNYFAYADGKGNLINHPQNSYAYSKRVYDVKGNLLEFAVYDKNENPCINKSDGTHKITYAYNKQNKQTEIRYYGTDGLRKNDYAMKRYKYNEQENVSEITYFNYLDKAINYNGFHKMVFSYDEQGIYSYLKRYRMDGSLEATLKWNKQISSWEFVNNNVTTLSNSRSTFTSNWRENWEKVAQNCPYTVSDEVEITSVSITLTGVAATIRFLEISKYNISDAELQIKKREAGELAQALKNESDMPRNTMLIFVCVDKAKRELFRVTY